MKKFMIDKSIYIAIGLVISILIQYSYIGFVRVLWTFVILVSSSYLGWEALIYPIDFILGKTERIVYFSSALGYYNAEFFKDSNNLRWIFYYSENHKTKKLFLIKPLSLPLEEIAKIKPPKANQKMKITYYRLSKLLCSWEILDE